MDVGASGCSRRARTVRPPADGENSSWNDSGSTFGRMVSGSRCTHRVAASTRPPASPMTCTRRSAHRLPTPAHQVLQDQWLEVDGELVHLDDRAAHHPAHHVVEPGVAGVVVGHVLEIANQGVEPQASAGGGVAEAHPALPLIDPSDRRHGDEAVRCLEPSCHPADATDSRPAATAPT